MRALLRFADWVPGCRVWGDLCSLVCNCAHFAHPAAAFFRLSRSLNNTKII